MACKLPISSNELPISLRGDAQNRASVQGTPAAPSQLAISSTEPEPAIDLKRLRDFAAVPENTLEHIALALESTEPDILAAVAPKTWQDFQAACIAASEVKRRAAINNAAEAGDLRRVEFLQSTVKKTDGCPRCQRLSALTDEELRARVVELQRVLDMPGTAVEAWPNLNWQRLSSRALTPRQKPNPTTPIRETSAKIRSEQSPPESFNDARA